jgi:hypothetical protein
MASKTLILLQDDIDGSEASRTVRFGFEGAEYEIDLSDKNAEKLHKALEPYLNAGRKVRGGRRSSGSAATRTTVIDTRAVRKWAEANGIAVSARGRISADVLEQYRAAGN